MADRSMNRGRKARKKVCGFCVDKVENIDYKDIARLRRYMSERGKILPRRVTMCVRARLCVCLCEMCVCCVYV